MNYKLKPYSKPTVNQPKRYGVIKLAQDVHAHFVVFSIQEEGQVPKAPRKMLYPFYRAYVEKLAAQSEKVYSCYEAGPTGYALHRELTKLGIENIVVAPVKLDERNKGVVNDNTDTLALASKLERYVAGNKRIFTVVPVPTPEQEQERALTRQRQQLQEQRLSLAAQGRSFVLTQGEAISNEWWKPKLWDYYSKKLASWLIERLEIFRGLILAIDQQMKALDERIQKAFEAKKVARPAYAGEKTLAIIENELRGFERFTSWRKVGSYSGLTGGVSSSGQSHSDLNITKAGNPRLRRALIQLAWRFASAGHQPDYWLNKKYAPILGPGKATHRRSRKKAIVAYARLMLVDIWKWRTGRITPEKLGWVMAA